MRSGPGAVEVALGVGEAGGGVEGKGVAVESMRVGVGMWTVAVACTVSTG